MTTIAIIALVVLILIGINLFQQIEWLRAHPDPRPNKPWSTLLVGFVGAVLEVILLVYLVFNG